MAHSPIHWLVTAARRAGLVEETDTIVERDATPEAAWTALSRHTKLTEDALAQRIAKTYRLGVADLSQVQPQAQSLVPERVARRHGVFPLRQTDRELIVATCNPSHFEAEQDLGFASGRTPVFEMAGPATIKQAIESRYAPERLMASLVERVDDAEAAVHLVEETTPETIAAHELEAAPVAKLTNLIIMSAIRDRASDIHIEPGREGGVVRFRIDGVLRVFMQLPMPALVRLVSRIKVMGRLDIADRLRPQDGRARVQAMDRTIDLRISTVPTREAEKVVLRLLDPRSTRTLEGLVLPAPELARYRRLLGHREGILLVTGPTGSGKTTLLYAALKELATGEINIMTVEDPIEYEMGGLTQIQVETKQGVTFASALRSILRQDPDVVFVGEMRDRETAEIAVQASLTGHLVLGTLHANDAVGAIARLVDLGVDRSKVATTLRGSIAQRLIRRVCSNCAQPYDAAESPTTERLIARYSITPTMRAVGCEQCLHTGYKGRVPVLEVMVVNSTIEHLINDGAAAAHIQKAAIMGGMRTLRDVALERVRAGDTTLEEVDRVLGDVQTDDPESAPADANASANARADAGTPSTESAAAPELPHILLVDDDAVARAMARAVLQKNGFRVTEAEDGVAGLEKAIATPDLKLVVLDLEMPRMMGLDVLDQLRKTLSTATMPVIVLTGSVSDDIELVAMDRGADDYVKKPLDPARFVARVKATLRRAAG